MGQRRIGYSSDTLAQIITEKLFNIIFTAEA
jgi:hypothetical protein